MVYSSYVSASFHSFPFFSFDFPSNDSHRHFHFQSAVAVVFTTVFHSSSRQTDAVPTSATMYNHPRRRSSAAAFRPPLSSHPHYSHAITSVPGSTPAHLKQQLQRPGFSQSSTSNTAVSSSILIGAGGSGASSSLASATLSVSQSENSLVKSESDQGASTSGGGSVPGDGTSHGIGCPRRISILCGNKAATHKGSSSTLSSQGSAPKANNNNNNDKRNTKSKSSAKSPALDKDSLAMGAGMGEGSDSELGFANSISATTTTTSPGMTRTGSGFRRIRDAFSRRRTSSRPSSSRASSAVRPGAGAGEMDEDYASDHHHDQYHHSNSSQGTRLGVEQERGRMRRVISGSSGSGYANSSNSTTTSDRKQRRTSMPPPPPPPLSLSTSTPTPPILQLPTPSPTESNQSLPPIVDPSSLTVLPTFSASNHASSGMAFTPIPPISAPIPIKHHMFHRPGILKRPSSPLNHRTSTPPISPPASPEQQPQQSPSSSKIRRSATTATCGSTCVNTLKQDNTSKNKNNKKQKPPPLRTTYTYAFAPMHMPSDEGDEEPSLSSAPGPVDESSVGFVGGDVFVDEHGQLVRSGSTHVTHASASTTTSGVRGVRERARSIQPQRRAASGGSGADDAPLSSSTTSTSMPRRPVSAIPIFVPLAPRVAGSLPDHMLPLRSSSLIGTGLSGGCPLSNDASSSATNAPSSVSVHREGSNSSSNGSGGGGTRSDAHELGAPNSNVGKVQFSASASVGEFGEMKLKDYDGVSRRPVSSLISSSSASLFARPRTISSSGTGTTTATDMTMTDALPPSKSEKKDNRRFSWR